MIAVDNNTGSGVVFRSEAINEQLENDQDGQRVEA